MAANDINPIELDFLLRFPAVPNVTSPVDFMSNNSWGGIKVTTLLYICRISKASKLESCNLMKIPYI